MKVRRLPSHKFLSKTESCFIIYHFLQACSLSNFTILLIAPVLSPTLRIVLDSSFSLTPFSLTRFHHQPMSKTSRSHILSLWDGILEWEAFPFTRVLPNPLIKHRSLHCRQILYQLSHKRSHCVDHNKFQKILKAMGISDYLSCLLRNVYVGQETTIRTKHGTMDWFEIENEYNKVVYFHLLINLYEDTSSKCQAG